MKSLFILLALFAISCSISPIKNKLISRNPGSISEKGRVLTLDKEALTSELEKGEFYEFIKEAQAKGLHKVVFEEKKSSIVKASMTEETSIAGDFYVLIGTNFTEKDELIRKGDFNDIYETAKRMSGLKFRVTINLVASIVDLKNALANQKPTIIVWTSHGNKEAFYDFNLMPVPFDVFKNASPSVYQFHLASCEGFHALQATYMKDVPKSMKIWGWQNLTYHPGTLAPHFDKKSWNPYINYPSHFSYNGLTCIKNEDQYVLFDSKYGAEIGNNRFENIEECNYLVANSSNLLVCNKKDLLWEIHNRKLKQIVPGLGLDQNYDCASRITNVFHNKMCRLFEDTSYYHFVNVETLVRSDEVFEDIWACYNYVHKSSDI